MTSPRRMATWFVAPLPRRPWSNKVRLGMIITEEILVYSANVYLSWPRVNYNSRTKTLWVRIMPTELHDVHQRWVRYTTFSKWQATGILDAAEDKLLDMGVGTSMLIYLHPRTGYANKRVQGLTPFLVHMCYLQRSQISSWDQTQTIYPWSLLKAGGRSPGRVYMVTKISGWMDPARSMLWFSLCGRRSRIIEQRAWQRFGVEVAVMVALSCARK